MAENEAQQENTEQQAQTDEADAVKKKSEGGGAGGGGGLNPKLLLMVLALNTLIVIAIAAVVFLKQKSSDQPTLGDIAAEKDDGHAKKDGGGGGHGAPEKKKDDAASDTFVKENFTVNLADSQGAHFAQVEIQIEVDDAFAKEEVQKLRPKIRDFIVVVLSSKTFEQVESNDGKDFLREEIRNKINNFLTRGQIKNVYFTQFIVQ